MADHRPVVTGLGVASPLGVGREAFWAALLGPPRALVSPPAREGLELPPACVFSDEFEADPWVRDSRQIRKSTNLTRLAVVAAQCALQDAGFEGHATVETDVVLGTCFGSSAYYLQFHEACLRKGPKGANAVLFTESVFNAPSGHVSQANALHGASLALAGGEEAGLSAVVTACDRLRLGSARAAVAGGADEYSDLVHGSLSSEGRVGSELGGPEANAPGPFAEGAALLIVESVKTALARQAKAWAQILGVGRARPGANPEGAAHALVRAARVAFAEADLTPESIDLVVGGGSGGPRSRRELAALNGLFGDGPPPLCAPQAILGEGFAYTSGALAVIGALAVATGRAPGVAPGSWKRVLILSSSASGAAVAVLMGKPAAELARA